jgi:crotonobetainyl-CoA:carnitine CoA-transferase CaiB-like acyl-CoA transferase
LTLPEALNRPQARARGNQVKVPRPGKPPVPGLRTPAHFDRWSDPEALPPPDLGSDTCAVLSDMLGMGEDEIDRLKTEGVI